MNTQITALLLLGVLLGLVAKQTGFEPGLFSWIGLGVAAIGLVVYAFVVSRIDIE